MSTVTLPRAAMAGEEGLLVNNPDVEVARVKAFWEQNPVAAEGIAPHDFRRLAGRHAQELVLANVDEIPKALRMPQRAFREDETGGEPLGFSGLEHVGQVVGCGHRRPHQAAIFLAACDERAQKSSLVRQLPGTALLIVNVWINAHPS